MFGCQDNCHASKLVAVGCTTIKPAVVACALLTSCFLDNTVHGQLRGGRTQRSLYTEESSTPPRGSGVRDESVRDDAVRQASAQRTSSQQSRQLRTPSIVNSRGAVRVGQSHGSEPRRLEASPASHISTAACTDCDRGTAGPMISSNTPLNTAVESFDDGYTTADYGGCDALGCDEMGCSSCDGYSELAPTCTSMACSPGCGPLMSLWCRMSVRAEVPLYWRRAMESPALVTTSPEGTDADLAGELGRTTTQILLGNGKFSDAVNAGVRLTLTAPLGTEDRFGLMFRYWNAGSQDEEFNFSSNQFPILARPFRDTSVTPAVANTQLIAFPGDSVGDIRVATSSDVDGLDLTLKRMIYMDRFTRVDWLWGYQHVSIDESLSISSNTNVTGNIPGLQGNSISVSDRFRTQNDFNGVGYGLMSTRNFACWKMESMFRLGLGNLRRQVNINGTTTTTANGATLTTSQGLLARNTNSRTFTDDTFVVLPEVGINFACMLRPGLDFNVGYNYMLVPKVAQASQQINSDLAVNLSDPLTGALDPALNFSERGYWINSLGLGLQLRY